MEFQSFDSYEAMMEAINRAREAADKNVQVWQAQIKAGDHFIQGTPYGFLIFGEALNTDDEFYKTPEGRNYRFCQCFSVACPDGEYGDIHTSVVSLVISEAVFNRFKDKGWNVEEGDSFS